MTSIMHETILRKLSLKEKIKVLCKEHKEMQKI